jgi:hypothetical protein
MTKWLVVVAALLAVTPAAAEDSASAAAMNRAMVEAHCPSVYQKGAAARAAICLSKAQRPVWAEYGPTMLDLVDAYSEAQLASAQKFDAGKISLEQYTAEAQARLAEFQAKVGERARREQCSRIIVAMNSPWVEPAVQAAALEKLRNLGCLRYHHPGDYATTGLRKPSGGLSIDHKARAGLEGYPRP